jgi:hypothetical protein
MSEPLNLELPLSQTGVVPVPETEPESKNHETSEVDSVEQSPASEAVETVSRETTEEDPVADAVAVAVSQWVGFDPAVHAVNPDGSPRLRVDGSYARKRGRGGRQSVPRETEAVADTQTNAGLFDNPTSVPRETPRQAPASVPETVPASLSSREAAAAIVLTSTAILARMVGPEWSAEKPELKALTDATKIYIDSKGGLQMSPEMGLFLAVSMYAAPRFAHENTRSKFSKAVDWCKDRIAVLRARFKRVK